MTVQSVPERLVCKVRSCKSPPYRVGRCKAHYSEYLAKEKKEERLLLLKRATRVGRTPGSVYAFYARDVNAVKFGYSTDVARRFSDIKASCPVGVEILGSTAGDLALERTIHWLLHPQKIRGEWYTFDGPAKLMAVAVASSNHEYIDSVIKQPRAALYLYDPAITNC